MDIKVDPNTFVRELDQINNALMGLMQNIQMIMSNNGRMIEIFNSQVEFKEKEDVFLEREDEWNNKEESYINKEDEMQEEINRLSLQIKEQQREIDDIPLTMFEKRDGELEKLHEVIGEQLEEIEELRKQLTQQNNFYEQLSK